MLCQNRTFPERAEFCEKHLLFFRQVLYTSRNSWEWTHKLGRDERVVGVHVWRLGLQTRKLPMTDRR